MEAYGDSAFAADNNQIGVRLILRQSRSNIVNLVGWRSCKSDRRAWSTLAAETHAMQMAMDWAIGLKYVMYELGMAAKETTVLTDKLNLKNVLYSGRSPAEARHRKEMGILRDMMGQDRIKVRFLKSEKMISDELTKDAGKRSDQRHIVRRRQSDATCCWQSHPT